MNLKTFRRGHCALYLRLTSTQMFLTFIPFPGALWIMPSLHTQIEKVGSIFFACGFLINVAFFKIQTQRIQNTQKMVKFLCWTKRVGHREAFVVFGAKEAILLPQREVINCLNYFLHSGAPVAMWTRGLVHTKFWQPP